jgi:hypothetical protein
MTQALLVFGSTFLAVFTLGLQSLNVNQGNYIAAALTSIGIGAGHICLYRYMPSSTGLDVLAYFAGGVTGITSSMYFHRVVRAWWHSRTRRADEHADVNQPRHP